MSGRKIHLWRHTVALVAAIGMATQPHLLLADEIVRTSAAKRSLERPHDIVLADGGLLVGKLVDEKGAALSMAPISLRTVGKKVIKTTTDKNGKFQVKGLRGGVYQIAAAGHEGIYRLWAPQTAPPAAQRQLTMVSHNEIVRGQYSPPPSNPLVAAGQFIAEHPILTASAVAAAIAIPLALDDDDPVPPPATP